jgi:hypothetical protein
MLQGRELPVNIPLKRAAVELEGRRCAAVNVLLVVHIMDISIIIGARRADRKESWTTAVSLLMVGHRVVIGFKRVSRGRFRAIATLPSLLVTLLSDIGLGHKVCFRKADGAAAVSVLEAIRCAIRVRRMAREGSRAIVASVFETSRRVVALSTLIVGVRVERGGA